MARVLSIGSLEAERGHAARIAVARGARLTVAEGAAAGLAKLRADGADLVLCDVTHDVGWLISCLAEERIACPVISPLHPRPADDVLGRQGGHAP
ncbi:MAG: hypothetical protein ACKO3H_01875 [Verrucomicrobiota bacterium]